MLPGAVQNSFMPGLGPGTQILTSDAGERRNPRDTPGDEGRGGQSAGPLPLRKLHAYPAAASRSAFSRSISCRLVMIEAKITTTVTMAMRMVQAALISGVTPRRTWE